MSLGLPKHRVAVAAYDPSWPKLYQEESERLRVVLGDWAFDIQHVGSTSIPDLPSKPIIDIGIAVKDFDEAFDCIPLMEELGYSFKGEVGVPRRHFFMFGRPRTYHVHMSEVASDDWRNRLAFRDYLRSHPAAMRAYRDLKIGLAERFADDLQSYSAGKKEFIENILLLTKGI